MKLFFETSGQAACFLLMTPIGFLAALMLDADVIAGRLRPAADVALLLLAGLAALWTVMAAGDSGLRAYHLLGLMTGVILYLQGAGRLIRLIRRKITRHRQEKSMRMQKDIHP